MAAEEWTTDADLITELAADPTRFEFFQAARLLARAASARTDVDGLPESEVLERLFADVRFRSDSSLRFPVGTVTSLERTGPRTELTGNFLGLVGSSGILPAHYTELLLRRQQLRDEGLGEFLDLFHHRALLFFWRAWAKYRLPVAVETSRASGTEDPITRALYALVGLGLAGMRDRASFGDEAWLYFSGHFSQPRRTAAGLEALLGEALDLRVEVEEFIGQWLELDPAERTCLSRGSRNNSLGRDTSLGARVWDVGSKVRVRIGPLDLDAFRRIGPGRRGHAPLQDLVRAYLGVDTDFELAFEMEASETPLVRLAGTDSPRLGRATWLRREDSPPLSTSTVTLPGADSSLQGLSPATATATGARGFS